MKILICSNAPWIPSGYGQQSKILVDGFKKNGHDIVFLTTSGLSGGVLEHENVLYAKVINQGNLEILDYEKYFQPNVVISLTDWYGLSFKRWSQLTHPLLSWTPIDLEPVLDPKEKHKENFDKFNQFSRVVTITNFGTQVLKNHGHTPFSQIPHGIDLSIFKPMPKTDFLDTNEYDFVIGIVMANHDENNRKAFDRHFEAVKRFAFSHPHLRILLFVHAIKAPDRLGVDLDKMLVDSGLTKYADVQFSSPMRSLVPYSQEELAQLYNSFDVLMNASTSEGFGIPIIEAQRCGVPVLTHDSGSMKELTKYGYTVKSESQFSMNYPSDCEIDDNCGNKGNKSYLIGYRKLPDVQDMVNGLEYIYESRNAVESQDASDWSTQFDSYLVADKWNEAIERV